MANEHSSEKTASGEESPTTARPIDFDDEPQESGIIHNDGSVSPISSGRAPVEQPPSSHIQEEVPPKPPRPVSAQQQAESTLIEAFPNIDAKVVKAVLNASGGQVEPAFNALLGMSDPDAQVEETPPMQPPRPSRQVQQDEIFARQLAEHYQSSAATSGQNEGRPQQRSQSHVNPEEPYEDKDHSFFDDDLPVIRENVRQGFLQTQTKVNKWISDLKKRIDGDDVEENFSSGPTATDQQRQNFGPSQSEQQFGIRKTSHVPKTGRRSTDQAHYDSDPRVLSDNFTELEMRDEEETPPKKPNRPLANPNLFKPTPPTPAGPVDEVDALYRQPTPTNRQPSPSAGKSKKWQPLTSVAPNPEADDNDPFSLGDSDEEHDAKSKDIRPEDTQRLKEAALQSEDNDARTGNLEAQERSGSMAVRNKDAEKLLTEKS